MSEDLRRRRATGGEAEARGEGRDEGGAIKVQKQRKSRR